MTDVTDLIVDCPDCGAKVVELPAQGGMRLDYPAVERGDNPAAIFGLMLFGSTWMAGAGGPMRGTTAHELHVHQPEGIE